MKTHSDDLAESKPEIDEYDEKEIVPVGMPLKHYMQEVHLCSNRLIKFKDILAAAGMDFSRIDRLKILNGACRELYSTTATTIFSSSSNQQRWETRKEEADLLLYDIKEAGIFACRKFEDLVTFVYSIYNEGGSNSDCIQNLNDYAVFGKKNHALFEAAGYDMANFDRAAQLSREMDDLLSLATLDKSDSPEHRIRRDKAFSIAKKTIDELHAQARYIFRKDKLQAAEFVIRPPRKKTNKSVPAKKAVAASVA
jgi:hypothetical protein